MSEHIIQCAKSIRCDIDAGFLHILAVATGKWPTYKHIWSMAEVCDAIESGDHFYIQNRDTLETFRLRRQICAACQIAETLETEDPRAVIKLQDVPVLR